MGVYATDDLRRRIRAARVLAGFDRMADLAAAIDVGGLGTDTLYEIERGQRDVRPHEVRLIADACKLPYEFFTTDLRTLGTTSTPSRSDLTLRDIDAKVSELLERWQETAMPAFTAYLDAQAAEVLAHDEEAAPSDEASATTQGRR